MPASVSKRALRQRIQRLIKKWRRIIALDHWSICVCFTLEGELQATCDSVPRYEDAVLDFNLDRIIEDALHMNAPALEELVVHELAHCIVGSSGTTENERQTTHVTRAILRAYYREK